MKPGRESWGSLNKYRSQTGNDGEDVSVLPYHPTLLHSCGTTLAWWSFSWVGRAYVHRAPHLHREKVGEPVVWNMSDSSGDHLPNLASRLACSSNHRTWQLTTQDAGRGESRPLSVCVFRAINVRASAEVTVSGRGGGAPQGQRHSGLLLWPRQDGRLPELACSLLT